MSESKPHSELRRAIEETRRRYGFPDIEKRYPATMLDTFFLKDAIALEEQYKHLENELDDMTGQFCNEAIHLTRAEDRVRELEEQLEALRFSAARYHETQNEVNALAEQLAYEWGWPDRTSVLQRLRGNKTAALTTFTEDAYKAFLGISNPATNASEPVEATQGPSTDGNPSSHPGSEASVPATESPSQSAARPLNGERAAGDEPVGDSVPAREPEA